MNQFNDLFEKINYYYSRQESRRKRQKTLPRLYRTKRRKSMRSAIQRISTNIITEENQYG